VDEPEAPEPDPSEPNPSQQDPSEHDPSTPESKEPAGPPGIVERVEVKARADDLVGIASSATEGVTGRADLERRPKLRPGEVVESVPGVIATQHSGGGKGHQYFLRGFNLDHGSDFRVSVGGMQVNLPTHGHGQGYADLNFLIPDLIDTVRFRKGTYYADVGDFSAAGSADIDYVRSLPEGIVEVTAGNFDYQQALVADSIAVGGGNLLGAVEYYHYDGPWDRPDHFVKLNGLVSFSREEAGSGFSITAMGYDGDWDATDQIPRRAVETGLIGRFGLIDEDLAGGSSRYSLSGEVHRRHGLNLTRISTYVVWYDLDLLSNFTYNLDDQSDDSRVDGDQFLQLDDRVIFGTRLGQERQADWGSRPVTYGYGLDLRYDLIDNALSSTRGGEPNETIREDDVDQFMGGLYADSEVRWSPLIRTRLGLRADYYDVNVDSNLDANSGGESDSLLSPKLGIVLAPWARTECYVNLGYGYHSNDARGATIRVDPRTGEPVDRVDPLVRAKGADVGFRTTALKDLNSSLSFFLLELDSELIFVGDAGGTEASRPSRRTGVEIANFYRVRDWLFVDLDMTFSDAEFTDSDPAGDHIPGAIEETVAAGFSIDDLQGYFGSLRWRYFGGRPLIEDNSVRSGSTSLLNARLGYDFHNGLSLALDIFNLLDRKDSDIEYYYASRLPGEPAEGVEDVHFHPMEERSFRVIARWRLR
jgi:hypothetical protein